MMQNRIHTFSFIFFSVAVLAGILSGCDSRESVADLFPAGECVFSLLEEEMAAPTRSLLDGVSGIETRRSGVTLAVFQDGALYAKQHFTSGLDAMHLSLEAGTYMVYALVNMGDMTSEIPSSESGMSGIVYTIPSYSSGSSSVASRGMPMAGAAQKTITSSTSGVQEIPVKRLLAKVTVTLSCDWDGAVVSTAKVYNMNSRLEPFSASGSAAALASDMLSFQEVHSTAEGTSRTMTAVFYVPENMQGTVSGVSSSSDKRPDGGIAAISSAQYRLTYLEVGVSCSGSGAPYSGGVVYRSYLGNNATSNFDIAGNTHYRWTILYHEDGLQTDNWKVDPDLIDNRWLNLENPIWVEPGDEYPWADVLSFSSSIDGLDYVFSNGTATVGTVIDGYDDSYSGGFRIKSGALAGKYVNLQVKPDVNPSSSVTKSSQVRVIDRVVSWFGYDESIYSDEDKKVYCVNPGEEVVTSVDFYYQWGNRTIYETGKRGLLWDYSPSSPATGITSSYSSEEVTYSVSESVSPGDYPIVVSRLSPHSGSDVAYLRVNDVSHYLEVTPSSATGTVGHTICLEAIYHTVTNGVDDGGVDVTTEIETDWSRHSGSSQITVNNSGRNKGKVTCSLTISSPQNAVIRASYNGYVADASVTFNPDYAVSYRLVLTPNPGSLEVSCYGTYKVWRQEMHNGMDYGSPVQIPNTDVTWQTSSSAVATVVGSGTNAGRATGVSVGSVIVTVTLKSGTSYYSDYSSSGRTASATLNVLSSGGWNDGWENPGSEIEMGN